MPKEIISKPKPRQIWKDENKKSIIKLDHTHESWLELFIDLIFGNL